MGISAMTISRPTWLLSGVLLVTGISAFGLLWVLPTTERTDDDAQRASGGHTLDRPRQETYTVEWSDYTEPPNPWDGLLQDDRLEDKHPEFDPSRVHPSTRDGWQVNLSDAVIQLDVPTIKPDVDTALLDLHASYKAALDAARRGGSTLLPSVNLIDGLAKQFDDGLYAALDQAYYSGLEQTLTAHVDVVRRIHAHLDPSSAAAAYLAAGLALADVSVPAAETAIAKQYLKAFLDDPVRSKPIGFYTWNPTLERCFRFLRYFQTPLAASSPTVQEIARVLREHEDLRNDYERANEFYSKLTNPLKRRGFVNTAGLSEGEGARSAASFVSFFPPSGSRESELFERLFPDGLPPDANLMRELITRIRSGEVDLSPRPDSGWYDFQVHALETMLLPERGAEHERLLLTKGYKRRMLEAFAALVTKRRETHVRQLDVPRVTSAVPRQELKIAPDLRLEPALTYYLRTARAYDFLARFLDHAIGADTLKQLRGLREGGARELDLWTELNDIRDRFYGFYLLGCEDIGMLPETERESSTLDPLRARELAAAWLAGDWRADPDLARDTRVAVPICHDPARNITRLWVTLGVRQARLNASFGRGPRVRPQDGAGEWATLPSHQLRASHYLIAVDEFAEIELKGARVLTRDELRAICDTHKTKAAIIKAFQQ